MRGVRNQQDGGVWNNDDSWNKNDLRAEPETAIRDEEWDLKFFLSQQLDQSNHSCYSVDNTNDQPNESRHGKETSTEDNSNIRQGIQPPVTLNPIESRDDILRSSFHHRNEILAEAKKEEGNDSDPNHVAAAENSLIDLIYRGTFNFALQRARFFPDETFAPYSSTNPNLALHELIGGMALWINGNSKGRRNNDKELQPESDLLWLLIETNPNALSTQGNGGYLPLHIACLSSFRDDSLHTQTRLDLIRTMLTIYPESATHNENETGELPLHVAIRWICDCGEGIGQGENDEPIVVCLLMAYSEGAAIRDHMGLTPLDILQEATSRVGGQQNENDEGGNRRSVSGGSVVQRLEGYLSFASQLTQSSKKNNRNENHHQQARMDSRDSTECIESSGETREPHVERNESPMDHLEFAGTMSPTEEFIGKGWGCIASSESGSKNDRVRYHSHHNQNVKGRMKGKRTTVERNEMDDKFALDLLNDLLDPLDDPLPNFHKTTF
jgi:hypothetical protein